MLVKAELGQGGENKQAAKGHVREEYKARRKQKRRAEGDGATGQ